MTPDIGPEEFAQPPVKRSTDRILDVELVAEYAQNRIGADRVFLRSYNGALVGPTIRVKPGDTLRIHLRNRLPKEPSKKSKGSHANEPHGFNVTNLHTHGLHVSPSGRSDNVLLKIGPGEDFHYEFQIPDDHPAGTFWYHPHKHGSVALQVASAMGGALIVEGGVDGAPGIDGVSERVFVFQQIPYEINDDGLGRVEDYEVFQPLRWRSSGRHTTVNGIIQPTLRLQPGEVQRWRFIHAGVRESILAKAVRCDEGWTPIEPEQVIPLHEIATDGFTRYAMADKQEVELQPGNRSDVLARFERPGNYCVLDEATAPLLSLHRVDESRRLLAKVRVTGAPRNMPLPHRDLSAFAPYSAIDDAELTGTRELSFNIGFEDGQLQFEIDGRTFAEDRIDQRLQLGDVEEWRLRSKFGNHPFHIHVNPFQVVEGAEAVWRDTVLVRPGKGVVMRTRYRRFTGKFVLHCHILDHEDRGMMQLVEIVP